MKRSFILASVAGVVAALAASALSAQTTTVPAKPQESAKPRRASGEPADSVIKIMVSADGKTIFVVGDIEIGSFRKFRRVLAAAPKAETVFLSSPGGNVLDGYVMGTLVRQRKLKTHVEIECSSSCTQIFLAGQERTIATGGQLGFHESWSVDDNGVTTGSKTDRKSESFWMRASFDRAGVEKSFADRAISTPFNTLWYPSFDEMKAAKVVTGQSAQGLYQPPVPIGLTRPQIEAALMPLRLFNLLAKVDAPLLKTAIDKTWRHGQMGGDLTRLADVALINISDLLSARLVTAPDDILDAQFQLWRDEVAAAKKVSFIACAKWDATPDDYLFRPEYMQRLANIHERDLAAKKRSKAFKKDEAFEIVKPPFRQALYSAGNFESFATASAEKRCQFYTELLTIVGMRPAKQRARFVRAFLSYGLKRGEAGI